MGKKELPEKITIKDIAKATNVSPTTVSLVLNDRKARISEVTKNKVKQAAKELGYTKNRNASSLVTSETRTIGLIVPDISNQFFSELAKYLGDYASSVNYNIFIANSYNNFTQEEKHLNSFYEQNIDGLILTTTNPEKIGGSSLSIPTVFIDRQIESKDSVYIGVNDRKGGEMIADLFVENNHTKVAGVLSHNLGNNSKDRISGFVTRLKDKNYSDDQIFIYEGADEKEAAEKALINILEDQPTAVFASNDSLAIFLMSRLINNGISIPEDISVAGFDDIPVAELYHPNLTTIKQPLKEIGEEAINQLISMMNGVDIKNNRIVFPLSLEERGSVINNNKEEK